MKRTLALLLALSATAAMATASPAAATRRSGTLHVTKDCSQYDPNTAGSSCTITGSNIEAIKNGAKVVYASAAVNGKLDSDLYITGPGHNRVYGHVVLEFATLTGVVTLSGGTGPYKNFQAGPLNVACPDFPVCTWEGPYSFAKSDDD